MMCISYGPSPVAGNWTLERGRATGPQQLKKIAEPSSWSVLNFSDDVHLSSHSARIAGKVTPRALNSSTLFNPNFRRGGRRRRRRMRSMEGSSNGGATAAPPWAELALERVLWSPEELEKRVEEISNAISEDFSGKPLAVVGVATGAFMFLADLVRKIKLPVAVDLIRVQSYGARTQSSGVATLMTDIRIDVKDKHVLLVEDIIDTGVTLSTLIAHFEAKGAASLSVCTLLNKVSRRVVPLQLATGGKYYQGFECPDEFVVGYGMDFAEEYRNLPCVGVLKPEVYSDTTAKK